MKKISLHLFLLFFAAQIAIAQTVTKSEFRLTSDKTTANIDDIITVNIETKNFKDMLGFEWAMKWKINEYQFLSAQIKNIAFDANSPNQNEIQKGTLFFSWNFSVLPENLADGTSIYTLKFKAKKSGAVEGICFSQDALLIEVLKDSPSGAIVPVQADFIGLGCGFVWKKSSKGDKTITALTASPTGTKDLATFESRAFPNPFSTSFSLQNNSQNVDNVIVTLFDVLGKIVLEEKHSNVAQGESITIDASNLSNGQYIYSMKTANGTSQGKLIKE